MTNSSAIKTALRKGPRSVELWPEMSTATKWTSRMGAWTRDDGIVSTKIKGRSWSWTSRRWVAFKNLLDLGSHISFLLIPKELKYHFTKWVGVCKGRHCLKIASNFLRRGWFTSLAWSDSCSKATRRVKGLRSTAGREARSLTDSKDWFTLETLRADCKDSTVWWRSS